MSEKNIFGRILHELNGLAEDVLDQLFKLIGNLKGGESDLWYEKLKLLITGPSIIDSLVKKTSPRQSITVLPDLTLSERIGVGNYDEFCLSITEENFPYDPASVGEWEWALFEFEETISSQLASLLMVLSGWQPATMGHLLAFGAKYPDEQRRHFIVGLGSVCCAGDDRRVPILWFDEIKRYLDLRFWLGLWRGEDFRFLAVRRKTVNK